ncbi:unnamed protein product [Peniophora sp. CBMAI 1063]|nr:unnamed protein product [Peniophora sp. CBMAI 1063]
MNSLAIFTMDWESKKERDLEQLAPIRVARYSLLFSSLGREELSLPPMLAAPRASSLHAPSLSGASTMSSSAFDSRPATPLDEESLQGLRVFDAHAEYDPLRAPKLNTIALPDVGEVDDFEIDTSSDYGDAGDYITEEDYMVDRSFDELEPLSDRVRGWALSNEEHDQDGTYAVAIPESLQEAWGGLGGKTPKAVRPALPATPSIRVSRP